MITSPAFAGKRYAVLGLARSGVATVDALVASGAEVVAWDAKEEARSQILPGTGRGTSRRLVEGSSGGGDPSTTGFAGGPPPRSGEDLVTLADPLTLDLTGFAGVVVSPGVPLNRHPVAGHAAKFGVPVIGDIELFAQARASLPPHKVVGITGTNGKSTTTALVHHILKTAGVPATMGGNIGLPILAQEPLPEGGVYVLELSSYQIDLTFSLDCDVAVLLNVTPDHLDRYDGFEAYRASKGRLLAMQSPYHLVVTGNDGVARDVAVDEAERRIDVDPPFWLAGPAAVPDQSRWPALQGPHNAENAGVAIEIARALGVGEERISEGLRSYPGLPHRMEVIGSRQGVTYVNDSKATNPESAAPALAAYDHIHWIVGGRAKGDNLDPCLPYLRNVRFAYTIGEAGPGFAGLLSQHVPTACCETLERAVGMAADAADPGEVVLLSPACASFDQFTDYEARGQAFRDAVEALGR